MRGMKPRQCVQHLVIVEMSAQILSVSTMNFVCLLLDPRIPLRIVKNAHKDLSNSGRSLASLGIEKRKFSWGHDFFDCFVDCCCL